MSPSKSAVRIGMAAGLVALVTAAVPAVAYQGPPPPSGYPHVVQVAGATGLAGLVDVDTSTASSFGDTHFGRRTDGRLIAWGAGRVGQLGDGVFASSSGAKLVKNVHDVVAVTNNHATIYALSSTGAVWSWGHAQYGLLGTSTGSNRSTPKRISSLPAIKSVVADEYAGTTYAVARDGRVFAWGRSQQCYWLGDGRNGVVATRPVRVRIGAKVASVATFIGTEAAITRGGAVITWGLPGLTGRSGSRCSPKPVRIRNLPAVRRLSYVGENVLYALTRDGHVWSWGTQDGRSGNLFGYAVTGSSHPLPKRISISGVARLAPIDGVGIYAFLGDGRVKAWGAGTTDLSFTGRRIIGNGARGGSITPVVVPSLAGATKIFPFAYASAAAQFPDGSVKAWGFGRNDGFGTGSNADLLTPTAVDWALGLHASAASDTEDLLAALPSGEVLWGNLDYTYPQELTPASGFGDVVQVLAHDFCGGFTLRRPDGTAWHVAVASTGGLPGYCTPYE